MVILYDMYADWQHGRDERNHWQRDKVDRVNAAQRDVEALLGRIELGHRRAHNQHNERRQNRHAQHQQHDAGRRDEEKHGGRRADGKVHAEHQNDVEHEKEQRAAEHGEAMVDALARHGPALREQHEQQHENDVGDEVEKETKALEAGQTDAVVARRRRGE
jgi:hypothetical protein